MTSLFISIAIYVVLILIEKQFTLTIIAKMIIELEDFNKFMQSLLSMVYAKIIVVFFTWFLFEEASVYVTFYALMTFITIFRVDLENIEENFDKLKNMR